MDILKETLFTIFSYNISIMDIIDLSLVSYLLYRLYKVARGTAAINIFLGLVSIYLVYLIFWILGMRFITQILSGFISITFIIIVILFQQEIRKYLNQIGKGKIMKNNKQLLKFFQSNEEEKLNIEPILRSCCLFSENKTGAIIVLAQTDDLDYITDTAVKIDGEISFPLLDSIFYKNSPLHDGAVLIHNNKIVASRCVLPISNDDNFPSELGMRHRAAVGISEHSDAITIIVSEQDGKISYTYSGEIKRDVNIEALEKFLRHQFDCID